MADPLGFRQKGTAIPRGFQSEATDADPSEQSGFAANIGIPVWKQFVDNQSYQESSKGAINAEQNYQHQVESQNRSSRASSSSGGSWASRGGKMLQSRGKGIFDEYDPESLSEHPELGSLARKTIWERDADAAKRDADERSFRLKDPTDRRALTDKERADLELESSLADETTPEGKTRAQEVKNRLAQADARRKEEKDAYDAEVRHRNIGSTDADTYVANRQKPTIGQKREQATQQVAQTRSQIEVADQSAAKDMTELNARLVSGVKGSEVAEVKQKLADLTTARAEIAKTRNEADATVTAPVRDDAARALRGDAKKLTDEIYSYMNESGRTSKGSQKSMGDSGGMTATRGFEVVRDGAEQVVADGMSAMKSAFTGDKGSSESGILDAAMKEGDLLAFRAKTEKELQNYQKTPGGSLAATQAQDSLRVMDGLIAKFGEKGITDGAEMMKVMRDAAKENTWAAGDETKVRQLSDGRLVFNPASIAERDANAVLGSIDAQNASDEQKSQLKENYEFARDHFAADLHVRIMERGDPDYIAHVKKMSASGEDDPSKLVYSWDKMSPGWWKKNGDLVADIGAQTWRSIANTGNTTLAEGAFGASEATGAMGMDGASKWLKEVATGSIAAMQERGSHTDYDEALAAARGERGAVMGVAKDFSVTAGAMIPMAVGGIGGGALKAAAGGVGMMSKAGTAIQVAGVYGYAGLQGVQSIFETAIQQAEQKAAQEKRTLSDEERYSIISDNQIPALANGLQTVLLTKLGSGSGVERAALGTIGAGGGKLTMKEIATQFMKRKTTMKVALAELKPEIKAMFKTVRSDFTGEMLEEGANQVLEGLITQASVNPNMTMEEIVHQSVSAGIMGGFLGAGLPGAKSLVTTNNQARTQQAMAYAAQRQLLAGPSAARVNAAMTATDPEATPATEEELTLAHQLSSTGNIQNNGLKAIKAKRDEYDAARRDGRLTDAAKINDEVVAMIEAEQVKSAQSNAEGVTVARDIAAVRAEDEQHIAGLEADAEAAVASGDATIAKAAQDKLEKAKASASRADKASAVLKLSTGTSPDQLADNELRSLGYKSDDTGGAVPMTPAELKAAGLTKPLLRPGADGTAIILDEAINSVKRMIPNGAARITMNEAAAMQKSVERKAEMDKQAAAAAAAAAIPKRKWTVGLKSGATIEVEAEDAASAEAEAAATANEPIVLGSAAESGAAPATPPSTPPPAAGAPGGKALAAAAKRIAKLMTSKKLADAIVVSPDPKVRATQQGSKIYINPEAIIADAIKAGMNEAQAAQYFARTLDEEIRHLAHNNAARALWESLGSPSLGNPSGAFEAWRDAHYKDIWETDFVATGKDKIVRDLYSADVTGGKKGTANFDKLPEWKKAMEAIRMMSQGNKTTEAGRLWIDISDKLREAMTFALDALKSLIADIDATPTLKNEVEMLEKALVELKANDSNPADPTDNNEKPPADEAGDGTGEEGEGSGEEPSGDGEPDDSGFVPTGEAPVVGSKVEFERKGETLRGTVTKIKKGAAIIKLDAESADGNMIVHASVKNLRVIAPVENGTPPEAPPEAPPAAPGKRSVVENTRIIEEWFHNLIYEGKPVTAKMVKEKGETMGLTVKEAEEITEAVISGMMQSIAQDPTMTNEVKFGHIVHFYENGLPALVSRTSESKSNQAYSTPAPLAFVASILADIKGGKVVSEPTFGHGILLMMAGMDGQIVQANELDPARVTRSLAAIPGANEWDISTGDATTWTPPRQSDRIISNPPFGKIINAAGETIIFQTSIGETSEIDHAIMLKQLEAMAPDGRAVFIIGGPPPIISSEKGRAEFYSKGKRAAFFKHLYDNYGVVDHMTLAGKLYAKQGAAYPVDIIVIQGKKSTGIDLPSSKAPTMISSWDQLFKTTEQTDEQRIEQNTTPPQEVLDDLQRRLDELAKGGKGKRPNGDRPDSQDGQGGQPDDQQTGLPPQIPDGGQGGNGAGGNGNPDGVPGGTGGGSGSNNGSGNGGPGGAPPVDGGSPPNGNGPGGGRKSLSAEQQEAIDLLGDLFAAPLRPDESPGDGFEEGVPPDKLGAFINLANKMLAKGIDTTQKLADFLWEMTVQSGKDFRRFTDAFWSMMRTMKPALPRESNWDGVYTEFAESQAPETDPEPAPEPDPAPKDPPTDPEKKEKVNEFQDKNIPVAEGLSLGTLVPKNLSTAMREALLSLQERVGPLHEFVHKELGYDVSMEQFFKYFASEQIEALALAIDNFYQNGALIVGDQTGIGKGRVVAGLIKWAMHKGLIPVFVTKNPSLMNAMLEDDMKDIGMEEFTPAITHNRDAKIIRNIKALSERKIPMGRTVFEDIAETGELPAGAQGIFTTYSQISADTPRDVTPQQRANAARRGQAPPDHWRMKGIKALSDRSVMILDESHLASGQSTIGYRFADLLGQAKHVYFSSATFAKRPTSMAIYFRTNMRHVTADGTMEKLIEIMEKGGVPAMQMASYMLAKDGQMLRRERDFDGVDYTTVINKGTAENDIRRGDIFTSGLREIVLMQGEMTEAAEEVNDILKAFGRQFRVPAANRPKLESMNFSGKIHNLISQYMLAVKADAVVERARAEIESGRKVVVAVQSTMESGIDRLVSEGRVPPNYKEMLLSHLDTLRTFKVGGGREITINRKSPEKYKDKSDAWLNQHIGRIVEMPGESPELILDDEVVEEIIRRKMIGVFLQYEERIEALDIADDLPLSPIDYMREKIGEFGITTNEITGRGTGIDEDGETYKREIPGATDVMRDFNTGDVDFLVINQSGSTGISLHDSEKNDNAGKHPRTMIVAQPNLDINEFMQMLGRIHRSGQKSLPKFILLQTALPAERRPAAVLGIKMAMLNANTTSNDESAVSDGNKAVDIFNKYGDEIVFNHLMTDRDLVGQLAMFPVIKKDHLTADGLLVSMGELEPGFFARRITGYLAVMPTEEQELFWERVTENYTAHIKYLDEIGENDLKAQPIDMKAKTLHKTVFTPGKNLDSIFAGESYYETVEGIFGKPPISGREARRAKDEMADEKSEIKSSFARAGQAAIEDRIRKNEEANAIKDAAKSATNETPEKRAERINRRRAKQKDDLDSQREQVRTTLAAIDKLGKWIIYKRDDGSQGMAIIESVDFDEKRPFAPSAQTFKLLLNDTKHSIRVPATKMEKYAIPEMAVPPDAWDMTMDNNTTRTIVTGNLLAALDQLDGSGKVISFTRDNGDNEMGIMLPSDFTKRESDKRDARKPVTTAEEFVERLTTGGKILNADESLRVMRTKRGDFAIRVPAKRATGGKFWRNPAFTALLERPMEDGGPWSVSSIALKDLAAMFEVIKGIGETLSSEKGRPPRGENPDGNPDDDTDPDGDDDGGLDAAPLRADSPEWKAMSKDQRKAHLAGRGAKGSKTKGISKPSNADDPLRVGTSKLGTKAVPVPTTSKSNISGKMVPPELLEKQMHHIRYDHLPASIRDEQDVLVKRDKFISWMKGNLLALYDAFPSEVRDRATHWYDGANLIAKDFGKRFGATAQQAAGVLAVLSPQKDWFMNVAQAEQVMNIWRNYQNTKITAEMVSSQMDEMVKGATAPAKQKKKAKPGETKLAKTRRQNYNKRLDAQARADRRTLLMKTIGKSVKSLDKEPYVQAWAIRLLAQSIHGRDYRVIAPEGEMMGVSTKADGTPQKNGWGSASEIMKAVRVLKDGSLESISENLGDQHKVRNFYNNIIAPNSRFGDATIDTHAVAAAHLMPMGASATAVSHNFGSGVPNSGPLGISGVYHLYLDAYRQAAAERGILPRQMQSIVWEAVRQLYPAESRRDKNVLAKAKATWKNNSDANARKAILRSGISSPTWAGAGNDGQSQILAGGTGKAGNSPKSGGGVLPRSGAAGRRGSGGGLNAAPLRADDLPQTAANIIALAKELDPAAFKAAVEDVRAYIKRRKADGVALSPVLMGDQITLAAQGVLVKYADNPRALRMLDGYGEDQFSGLNAAPLTPQGNPGPSMTSVADAVKAIRAGRTDTPLKVVNEIVAESQELRSRIQAESERRRGPRSRGAAAILERIARERSAGTLTDAAARGLTDFVNKLNPRFIADDALSIKQKGNGGTYEFAESLVSLFQGKKGVTAHTGIHEFWHSLSRYLPAAEAKQVEEDYKRDLAKHIAKNPGFLALVGRYGMTQEQYDAYAKFASPADLDQLTKLSRKDADGNDYKINFTDANYRFVMVDEYLAERMADLVLSKQKPLPDTVLGRLVSMFRDFTEMIRTKMGKSPYEAFYNEVMSPTSRRQKQRFGPLKSAEQIFDPQGGSNMSVRLRETGDDALNAAPLGSDSSQNINDLRIMGGSRINQDLADNAREIQELFDEDGDRTVGAPRLANPGDTQQSREQQMVVDALYEHDREVRKDADVIAEGRRRFLSDPKGVEEKVLAAGYNDGEALTDADVVAARFLINQRSEAAGNDLAKHEENMILRMAYRLARAETARSLRIGFDQFQKPEDRMREFLTERIYAPTLNIEKKAANENWSPAKRREAVTAMTKTRLAQIEKAFSDMGITFDEVLSGKAYLSLSKSAIMQEAAGRRSKEEQVVIEMLQKKWPVSRIRKSTGFSEEKIQAINKALYDELLEKARAKVRGGSTLETYTDGDPGLSAAPLTPEEVEAEAIRIVEVGFGVSPDVSTAAPATPKKPKSANPLTADWSRPDFKKGLESYTFNTTDRADILRRITEIRALAGAVGKIKKIQGPDRVKAIEHLKAIEKILAKHGTSSKEIFESGTPAADYRFDIRDRNQVAILARVIQAIDADVVDKTIEWVYSSILSGIQTMAVNAIAAVPATWDMTVGRGFEMAVNTLFKNDMSASSAEVKYILKAAGPALSRAMSNATATWGSETPMFDEDFLGREANLDKLFDGHAPKMGVIGGKKGRLIRIPTRMLLATDEFNRTAIAVIEIGAMAYRLAKAKGLTPGTAKFDRFLKIQVNTPGSFASKLAADKASRLIFTNALPGQINPITGKKVPREDIGDMAGAVAAAINKFVTQDSESLVFKAGLAALRLAFFPFQRTPFNLIRRGVRHTLNPISLIDIGILFARNSYALGPDGHHHWKWDGGGRNAEIVERLSQQLQGAMLLLFLMGSGAGEGDDDDQDKPLLITGSQPFTLKGRAERETQYRAGLGPYRISIRNKDGTERFGFNYGRIEPLATTLASTIDMTKAIKRAFRSGKGGEDIALSALESLTAQTQDKTFMKGTSDLISLADHFTQGNSELKSDKKIQQFLASRFGMFIPNIIKQPIRESDDRFRERADTFTEELLYQVFPSGIKNEKLDTYGEPIKKTGNAITRAFDVTDAGMTDVNDHDTMLLTWRDKNPNKAWFPQPIGSAEWKNPRTKESAKMNAAQLSMFREQSGKLVTALLKRQSLNTKNPTQSDIDRMKDIHTEARAKTKRILSFTPKFVRLSAE